MIYVFRCSKCGFEFNEEMPVHKYAEVNKKGKMLFKCPSCNKSMRPIRVINQPVSVIYKGKGFYVTDKEK